MMRGPEAKAATVHRLCKILHDVHDKRVGFDQGPCDCICPERPGDPRNWSSTGDALDYLEKLVAALPHGKTQVTVTERFRMGENGETTYHDLIVEPYTVPQSGPGDPKDPGT